MSSPLTLLLAGGTGLVGRSVLAQALEDRRIGRIVAPTRRPIDLTRAGLPAAAARRPDTSKLENPIVVFEDLAVDAAWWAVHSVVCALGTTIRAAGSREAFRRVDHDYVLAIARLARTGGARAFALTSAMGANPRSRIFYNRVKGETEEDVSACGFDSLTIVRPGLIGGERDESRPVEYAAQRLVAAAGPALPRGYRINPAAHIARALVEAAVLAERGVHIVTSEHLV